MMCVEGCVRECAKGHYRGGGLIYMGRAGGGGSPEYEEAASPCPPCEPLRSVVAEGRRPETTTIITMSTTTRHDDENQYPRQK